MLSRRELPSSGRCRVSLVVPVSDSVNFGSVPGTIKRPRKMPVWNVHLGAPKLVPMWFPAGSIDQKPSNLPYYRNNIALDHPVVNRCTALFAC